MLFEGVEGKEGIEGVDGIEGIDGTFEQTCLRKPHSLSRLSRIIGELDSGSGLWEGLWERIMMEYWNIESLQSSTLTFNFIT